MDTTVSASDSSCVSSRVVYVECCATSAVRYACASSQYTECKPVTCVETRQLVKGRLCDGIYDE